MILRSLLIIATPYLRSHTLHYKASPLPTISPFHGNCVDEYLGMDEGVYVYADVRACFCICACI